ncbi:hypothetical protein DH2020_039934 [Rehmannia glutinosa]|uniref:Uncharacterized protein n=1 Tax=Rehmannia glutinosa TaxID=99300 RepID=A0ABR0UUB5_REHGL
MALRLTARRTLSPSAPLLQKSASAGDISIVRRGRWRSSSSSSSSSSSPSPKPNKKVTNDRLASVIDAVNDRKLPPELRGQRNNVRTFKQRARFLCVCVVCVCSWCKLDVLLVVKIDIARGLLKDARNLVAAKGTRSETDIINVGSNEYGMPWKKVSLKTCREKGSPWTSIVTLMRTLLKTPCIGFLTKTDVRQNGLNLTKRYLNSIAGWRIALRKAWVHKDGNDDSQWYESSEALKLRLRDLNNKVFRYNLIVPFGRQMFGFKWEREIERLKEEEGQMNE